jgi:hypothetical protein
VTAVQGMPELHPAFREAWDFVEKVRGELLLAIRPVTRVQWTFRLTVEAWCIAEVLDHLLRAEIGTSKMVRKLIRGDFSAQALPIRATLYTKDLDRYPYGRLDAPHGLIPDPVREKPDLEGELNLAHACFRHEVSIFQGDDPEILQSPDPATGDWFTLGGWVKLQAWHEAHHLAQIRAAMASPYV